MLNARLAWLVLGALPIWPHWLGEYAALPWLLVLLALFAP